MSNRSFHKVGVCRDTKTHREIIQDMFSPEEVFTAISCFIDQIRSVEKIDTLSKNQKKQIEEKLGSLIGKFYISLDGDRKTKMDNLAKDVFNFNLQVVDLSTVEDDAAEILGKMGVKVGEK